MSSSNKSKSFSNRCKEAKHHNRQLSATTQLTSRVLRGTLRTTRSWLCNNKISPWAVELMVVSMLNNSLRMSSSVKSPLSRIKIRTELLAMVKDSQTCFRWQDKTSPAFTIEDIRWRLLIMTLYWPVNMMMLIISVEVPLRKTLQPSLVIIARRSAPPPIRWPTWKPWGSTVNTLTHTWPSKWKKWRDLVWIGLQA